MPDTEDLHAFYTLLRQPLRRCTFERVTPSEQVRAARASVLLVREPDLAIVVVTGEDRASWLNGLVTCDVAKLEEGAVAYGLAVTQKGRIIADLYVAKRAGAIDVVLPARVRDAVMEALGRYLVMEDAEMARDDDRRVWFAHGPKSAELGGLACDRTGLGGALVVAPASEGARLEARAIELGGCVGDAAGWEALRLEQGVPAFGVDFDDKTYPQEASLEKRAVSFEKGCYLGQEVVCMLELRGHVKRKLVPFVMEESDDVESGAPITDEAGVEIGKVSSASRSPTLGKCVGLAMVKLAHASAGATFRASGKKARVV
jgi:folate-binding protein YgfZ